MVVAMFLVFGRRLQFTTQQVQSLFVPYPAGVQKARLSKKIVAKVQNSNPNPAVKSTRRLQQQHRDVSRLKCPTVTSQVERVRSKLHPMIDLYRPVIE
jgi:hypothetical protein